MASYAFESMTSAEAAAFAASDRLSFMTPGHTGAMATVLFQPSGQISVEVAGRALTFGAGLSGAPGAGFANGSILFVGTPGGDVASGTDAGDGLYGGQGDDQLSGGAGDDLLQGNQGQDTLNGGGGNDIIYGGQGDDTILVGQGMNFGQGNLGNDTVSASAEAGRNTLLGGQGADLLIGGGDADFLNGNLGADSINGGGGDDLILGEGGADTLFGGVGADTFVAGVGSSDAAAFGTFVGEIVDRILDWTSADRIDKPGGALPAPGRPGIDPSYYYELSPATAEADADYYGPFGPPLPYDYWRARDECVRLMADNPTLDVIAVQSDNDVLVFIDADGGNAPDLAIRLVGISLDDIDFRAFI